MSLKDKLRIFKILKEYNWFITRSDNEDMFADVPFTGYSLDIIGRVAMFWMIDLATGEDYFRSWDIPDEVDLMTVTDLTELI